MIPAIQNILTIHIIIAERWILIKSISFLIKFNKANRKSGLKSSDFSPLSVNMMIL